MYGSRLWDGLTLQLIKDRSPQRTRSYMNPPMTVVHLLRNDENRRSFQSVPALTEKTQENNVSIKDKEGK